METRIAETEPRVLPATPISVAWMPRKLSTAASASLDIMRAVAACAVMFGHLRTLFFVDFQHLQKQSWPLDALYILTGFGHQSVMVFFVLSGFLISSTVIRSHVIGEWSWRDYAINRATRLYVVLVPGLLFGLMWDLLGSWLFASKGIYTHALKDLGTQVPLQNLTLGTFLGNLFFLQTIFCQTFGSNGPLWSLANEFWYYVLFPVALGAGLAWVRHRIRAAILLSCLVVVIALFVGVEILIGFAIWLSGCALVFLYSKVPLRSRPAAFASLCFFSLLLAGSLLASRSSWEAPHLEDLGVGFAFALFLYAVLQSAVGENSPRYSAAARRFAGFSYSLYVLHFPFLLFLRTSLVPEERWQPTPAHLLEVALIGAGCLIYAWLVSLFTEGKTTVVRRRFKRFLT